MTDHSPSRPAAAPGPPGPRPVDWSEADWLNPPAAVTRLGDTMIVTTHPDSDFWRTTSYGFVHDNGHCLLTGFPVGSAVEVSFVAEFAEQFDQAGLMVRVDESTWIKAGIEFADGFPQLGAVVTRGLSDWSTGRVPQWAGRTVTVRASRSGDAVTIRARTGDQPWQLVRLAPLDPAAQAGAGPMCCSPGSRALTVCFTGFTAGPADESLH
ncbi:MAG TPA: DUF1349 domain-containing protein [Actinocrinis sp.]|nr:DUF1349 domain-containing protein [Actinocrinis sp.]